MGLVIGFIEDLSPLLTFLLKQILVLPTTVIQGLLQNHDYPPLFLLEVIK